jgi:phosphohistidine phosphatase
LRIYLVRHGDADAEIPEGLGDEARTLTAKGRQAIAHHFAQLAERIGGADLVFTSPLARAVQTSMLLAGALRHEGPLRTHKCLLPDMPVGSLESVLNEHASENLIFVGHQPSMGAMAAHLLGLQQFPKPVNPGTVIALDRTDGGTPATKLLFYAAPGQPVLDTIAP